MRDIPDVEVSYQSNAAIIKRKIMKEECLSWINCFLGWLNSPPRIWVILLFLALFAGPEKIRKLYKDYRKACKRFYLCMAERGIFRPERPILSFEGEPAEIWGYSGPNWKDHDLHVQIYIHHNFFPYNNMEKGKEYDIWINHESLRERDDYKDCFWCYIDMLTEEGEENYKHVFESSKSLARWPDSHSSSQGN